MYVILISNVRHVLNVVCFLLGDSPASEINQGSHWTWNAPKQHKQRRWPDPKQIVETAFTHVQGKETATYNTVVW